MLTTPEMIQIWRMRVMAQGLRLEIAGMKRRGRSMYSIVKGEFGLHGSKERVFCALMDLIEEEEARYAVPGRD